MGIYFEIGTRKFQNTKVENKVMSTRLQFKKVTRFKLFQIQYNKIVWNSIIHCKISKVNKSINVSSQ